MVDLHYSEPSLADLYDAFCANRIDFGFYLPLVMSAERVLDVGCGTGELLRLAREAGHTGRLCGLDPAAAMLQVARTRTDIEWALGDLASVAWDREFDLVVMTGHAFQVLTEDEQLRASLVAIRSALAENGRFVFEIRNPLVRAWERWTPEGEGVEIVRDGTRVRMKNIEMPVAEGDLVSFTTAYTSPAWERPLVSRSTLRFLDADALSSFLAGAGLAIEEQFGDWDRQPLTRCEPRDHHRRTAGLAPIDQGLVRMRAFSPARYVVVGLGPKVLHPPRGAAWTAAGDSATLPAPTTSPARAAGRQT